MAGLYFLHSALNHACNPNAVVRRLPPPSASAYSASSAAVAETARPSQIHVVALRPLSRGDEVTLTYVNPQWTLESRRAAVRRDYMFECMCTRCVDELAQTNANGAIGVRA
jgi:SET domain